MMQFLLVVFSLFYGAAYCFVTKDINHVLFYVLVTLAFVLGYVFVIFKLYNGVVFLVLKLSLLFGYFLCKVLVNKFNF